MKIAHIIPPWGKFNFKTAHGIYGVAYSLIKKQAEMGNSVTLFASKGSKTDCGFLFETIKSLDDMGISLYENRSYAYNIMHAAILAEKADSFDIIHSHIEHVFLPFIKKIKTPVISTIHGSNFDCAAKNIFRQNYGKFNAVALSKSAIKHLEFIKFSDYVYNGLALKNFPLKNSISANAPVFWIGRMHPDKGALEANIVSKKTEIPIVFAGIEEKSFNQYGEKLIAEIHKNPRACFKKNVSGNKRSMLYSKSKLTLSPIQWEEPFGLVMIESMACGTPVVAFARGSVPEVIADGKTGFIVNPSDNDIRGNWIIKKTGIEGLVEAVKKLYALPENEYHRMIIDCRKRVEKYFTEEKMAESYEKIYHDAISSFTFQQARRAPRTSV